MGLLKFLLSHGGGPGAIARRQARLFRELTRQHPGAPEKDILTKMYIARAEAGRSIAGHAGVWYRKSLPSDPQAIEQFRNNPKLSLRDLILRIIDAEDPKSAMRPMELRFKILDVVDDVLDQELPDWKKKSD